LHGRETLSPVKIRNQEMKKDVKGKRQALVLGMTLDNVSGGFDTKPGTNLKQEGPTQRSGVIAADSIDFPTPLMLLILIASKPQKLSKSRSPLCQLVAPSM